MENSVKPLRTHRSEEEIKALLNEFEGSDVTVKEFCEIYSVSEATFYSWRNKFGTKNEKPGEFITLVNDLPAIDTSNLFAELEVPGKAIVRFFADAPVDRRNFLALAPKKIYKQHSYLV